MAIDFEPDDEVLIAARTPEGAREFFGAPPHWPLRAIERRPDGFTLYAIQTEGLWDVR